MDRVWMVALVGGGDDYVQTVYVRGGDRRTARTLAKIVSTLESPVVRSISTTTYSELDPSEKKLFSGPQGNVAVFEPEPF